MVPTRKYSAHFSRDAFPSHFQWTAVPNPTSTTGSEGRITSDAQLLLPTAAQLPHRGGLAAQAGGRGPSDGGVRLDPLVLLAIVVIVILILVGHSVPRRSGAGGHRPDTLVLMAPTELALTRRLALDFGRWQATLCRG